MSLRNNVQCAHKAELVLNLERPIRKRVGHYHSSCLLILTISVTIPLTTSSDKQLRNISYIASRGGKSTYCTMSARSTNAESKNVPHQ
jgi:hypothetical protein